jgi:hypothetical protein
MDRALKKAERNASPPFQRPGKGVARSTSKRRTTRSVINISREEAHFQYISVLL